MRETVEPRPLCFARSPDTKQDTSMPKPLTFDDPPKKPLDSGSSAPNDVSSTAPKALSFPEGPSKPADNKQSKQSVSSPVALSFPEVSATSVQVAPAPIAEKPKPKALDFPPDTRPKAPPVALKNFGQPVFENKLDPLEERAVEFARTNFDSLMTRHDTAIINGIRQLIPFRLEVVNLWGKTAIENQAELVNKMAGLTRQFHGLNVANLLEEMLQLPTKMSGGGFLSRFRDNGKLLSQHKLRAIGIQSQLTALLPQVEELHQRMKKEGDRIPILMVALASAASLEQHPDTAIEMSIQNRRLMLQHATTQLSSVSAQLQSMREQLIDYQNKIEHVINVTLPTMEMALVNGR